MSADPTTRGSMAAFIEQHGITATAEPAARNPSTEPDTWAADAHHWLVTLRCAQHPYKLDIPFSQGSAHTEPPTAKDVLQCVASDASGVMSGETFEDWASEYGYDTDSRRAERTYRAVKAQTERFRDWLGAGALSQLVWETDHD